MRSATSAKEEIILAKSFYQSFLEGLRLVDRLVVVLDYPAKKWKATSRAACKSLFAQGFETGDALLDRPLLGC